MEKYSFSQQWQPQQDYSRCLYCGFNRDGQRFSCPVIGKKCDNCQKDRSLCQSFFGSKEISDSTMGKKSSENWSKPEEKEVPGDNSSTLETLFLKQTLISRSKILPIVQVKINGIKGEAEADLRSTVNIIDESKLKQLQKTLPLEKKIKIKPVVTKLYAYGQETPILLIGSFSIEIESISSGYEVTVCIGCKTRNKAETTPTFRNTCETGSLDDKSHLHSVQYKKIEFIIYRCCGRSHN